MRTLRLALTLVFFASYVSQALATNQSLSEDEGNQVLLSAADQQKLSIVDQLIQAQLLRDSFVFISPVKETNKPKADDGGNQLLLRAAARQKLSARSEELKALLEELQAQLLREQTAEKNIRAAGGQKRVRTPHLYHANVHICDTIDRLKQAKDRLKRVEKSLQSLMLTHIYDLPRDVLWLIFNRVRFLYQLRFPQVCRLFRAVYNMAYVHPDFGPLVTHKFTYVVRNAVDRLFCKSYARDRLADEFDLHTMEGKRRFAEAYGLVERPMYNFSGLQPYVPSMKEDIDVNTFAGKERLVELFGSEWKSSEAYLENARKVNIASIFYRIYDQEYRRRLAYMSRNVSEMTEEITIIQVKDLPLSHISFENGLFANLRSLTIRATLRTVSPSLSQLPQLRKLDLSYNKLTAFPVEFWSLTQLESLLLDNNQIGALPEALGRLTNLKVLALNSNKLRTLPEGIGKLTRLWGTLELRHNDLEQLPSGMKYLESITGLDLSSNNFKTFPASICTMTNLTDLDLSNNILGMFSRPQHEAEIPDQICGLMNLKSLRIACSISNRVSLGITLLTKLVELDISKWEAKYILKHYNDEELRLFAHWYYDLKKAGCRIKAGKTFWLEYFKQVVKMLIPDIAKDVTGYLEQRGKTMGTDEVIAETRTLK